jgi:hypothetical protein
MAHTTEIVNVQHLADTQVAVTLRCCSDASTDSTHSIEVSTDHIAADLQAWLSGRHTHVQQLHEKRLAAVAFFQSLQAK